MEQAIFGLIGVLVGGLITWGIEWWREHQHLAGEARVAARMVTMELITASARFAEWEHHPDRKRPEDSGRPVADSPMWAQHRATLARILDADSWWTVNSAYIAVEGRSFQPDWRSLLNGGLQALRGPSGLETDPIPESPPR